MKILGHPELRAGEVFLGNFTARNYHQHVGWQFKRMRLVALDTEGRKIEDLFPVFVLRLELEKAEIPLEE
ncbi:MAG: hypothetical protein A3H64_00855 [Candidatus Ryanbacteria bacterium RIFCSPLOWO2_02_FULL_45_11c]|uniref:Uncharacterized protein n=1 Tax=Candidatus Ryanbacteria bacterium RIFCSPLOWO2_02_FULL_45_11c TaxID=1802128 RepID=A0A1G2H3R2_9BACT|nr:MAG: hypothetical protein A3H64_00855 [Candidatus Ryanbacteria bacterium RIFCSPLOWO2_02_FULL_45_11c]